MMFQFLKFGQIFSKLVPPIVSLITWFESTQLQWPDMAGEFENINNAYKAYLYI